MIVVYPNRTRSNVGSIQLYESGSDLAQRDFGFVQEVHRRIVHVQELLFGGAGEGAGCGTIE